MIFTTPYELLFFTDKEDEIQRGEVNYLFCITSKVNRTCVQTQQDLCIAWVADLYGGAHTAPSQAGYLGILALVHEGGLIFTPC
jgi:hypothetical protein